ncbi:hypothetical protein CGCFRS4_v015975 [Colletotrichum fructicola]|nr:hypothetical protein CGCFRS4_v015975 [Colletotrichum fructicola]
MVSFYRDTFCELCIQHFHPYDIIKTSSTELYIKYKQKKGWTSPVPASKFPFDVLFDYELLAVPRRQFRPAVEEEGLAQLNTRARRVSKLGIEDARGSPQNVERAQYMPKTDVSTSYPKAKALPPIPKQANRARKRFG